MGRPNIAQWVIATVVFVAIGLVGFVYGHMWSLGILLALLILIAVYSGRTDEPEGAGAVRDERKSERQSEPESERNPERQSEPESAPDQTGDGQGQ